MGKFHQIFIPVNLDTTSAVATKNAKYVHPGKYFEKFINFNNIIDMFNISIQITLVAVPKFLLQEVQRIILANFNLNVFFETTSLGLT